MMRSFYQTAAAAPSHALFRIARDGILYDLQWHHATLGQVAGDPPTQQHSSHAHGTYHAVLFRKGCNAFLLQGRETPCGPGVLALTAPCDTHDFWPVHPGVVEYDELTFRWQSGTGDILRICWPDLLAAVCGLERPLPLPPCRTFEEPGLRRAAACMEDVVNWLEARVPLSPYFAAKGLGDFLSLLLEDRALADRTEERTGSLEHRLHGVRRHIERRFRECLDADTLAGMAGVSQGHFQRAFKRLFGESPHQYQVRQRLQVACMLLSTSRDTCKEIAARVGYEDPVLFSRLFRKRFAESPAVWRKRQAAPEAF